MNYDEQILTLLDKNQKLSNLVRDLIDYIDERCSDEDTQATIDGAYEYLEYLESDGELEEE